MAYVIAGLGNPGAEYEHTRHNMGRIALEAWRKSHKLEAPSFDKKSNALVVKDSVLGESIVALMPETFMNKSGTSVAAYVKNPKAAQKLIVLQDELDLPLGSMKISIGRGSGGHRGIDSIIKAVKTNEFIRIRIGVCPATASGKLKKPTGEDAVVDFIVGPFKKAEADDVKKSAKKAAQAIDVILEKGAMIAMNEFN